MSSTMLAPSQQHQRTCTAEDEERVAGQDDAVKESFRMMFLNRVGSEDSPLLDGVFRGFCETNIFQGTHFSIDMVLQVFEKLFFRFEHASIPYLATVYRYRGPESDTVVLKLPNNGFTYLVKPQGEELFWHKRPGWVSPDPHEAMAQFPTLHAALSKRYHKVVVLYNFTEHRIDMEFEPRVMTDPLFLVTYEPGSPYLDTKTMRKPY
ncbi:hypothetical protein VaNZ11_010189 [Volvox africanus]|uniref:Uncharacterized protein n=1 Tax=Volvox africanus TaxID=51714 RepID=A0ABQ5SAM4_9CHLO|nr:hypothetical protein VaNZ11_010189 [Volvox africanus]